LTLKKSDANVEKQGRKMKLDQKRWDERFGKKQFAFGKEPNPFLKRHIGLLRKGKALDIATGEGRNAVFLAQHGFDVDAVDISKMGLNKARKLAKEMGVKIHTFHADLDTYQIKNGRYDLITNFYFLKRSLIPRIKKGLKKGGKIIFETYTLEHRNLATGGPKESKYFLKPNELFRLFHGFRILRYREGIFREGGRKKAIASLIAEKT
jgi:2-polyprenyl-3-methyl-5-hydroxy-6-metoxy-1,4-benzoquinol methylase